MKYFKIAVVSALAFLMLASPEGLKATHIVGADMTFTCNAKGWFDIHLTVRRDCINGDEEADFEDPAFVGIYDAFGTPLNWLGSLGSVVMELESVEDIPINDLGVCTADGGQLCVSEARYVGRVSLPFREGGYILGYQRCCRNATLNNIVSPLETGNTSFVCISEESLDSCNSSPQFGDWPDIIICAGQPLTFDASASDIDADSLAYRLFTPHTGGSIDIPQPIPPTGPPYDTVEYASGFSLENLLGSGTPLTINSETGILTATPGAVGQYLVGILVEEWRDGILLSKTRRNFEYNVRICAGGGFLSYESTSRQCEGLTVAFTNTSTDLEGPFNWNFNYPDGDSTFMSTEVSPSFMYPEPGTYQVRLTSTGSEPTCNSEVIRTVEVINSQLTATFDSTIGECVEGQQEITLTSTSIEPNADFQIYSPIFTVSINGVETRFVQDVVTLLVNCTDIVIVTIGTESSSGCMTETTEQVLPLVCDNFLSFESTDRQCEGLTVAFTNTSTDLERSFTWNFNYPDGDSTFISTEVSPSFTYPEPGTYQVRLTSTGLEPTCTLEEIRTVEVINSQLTATFDSTIGECIEGQQEITLISTSVEPNADFQIDSTIFTISINGVETRFVQDAVTLLVNCTDTVIVTIRTESSSGCMAETTEQVLPPVCDNFLSFESTDRQCEGLTVAFTNTSTDLERSFTWNFNYPDGDSTFISTEVSPSFTYPEPGTYQVRLTSTGLEPTCTLEEIRMVEVINSQLTATFDSTIGECVDGQQEITVVSTSVEPNGDFQIGSTIFTININGVETRFAQDTVTQIVNCSDTVIVTIRTESSSGCMAETTEQVLPPVCDNFLSFESTGRQCEGLTVAFTNTSTDLERSFTWNFDYPDGDSTFISTEVSPSFTYPEPGTYQVRLTSMGLEPTCTLEEIRTVEVINSQLTATFDSTIGECIEGQQEITVVSTSVEPNGDFQIGSTIFTININGIETRFVQDTVTQIVNCSDTVIVTIRTESSSGCMAETTEQVLPPVCDNFLSFESTGRQCEGLTVAFTNTSTDLERSFTWNFNYPDGDSTFISTEVSPSFTYPEPGTYQVRLTSMGLEPTCTLEEIRTVEVINSQLTATFDSTIGECVDSQQEITVVSTSVEPNPDFQIDSTIFTISINGIETRFVQDEVTVIVNCSDTVIVTIRTESSSGCMAETTEQVLPPLPPDEKTVEFINDPDPILVCIGDTTRIVANPNPNCTYIWSPTDGLDLTDPSDPIASPSETTVYTVTVTDGTTTIVDSVTVEVLNRFLDLSIVNNSTTCGIEVANLSAIATNSEGDTITYEWSLDSSFTSIVATGVDVEIPISGETTIYLRGGGTNICGSNVPSITLNGPALGINAEFSAIDTCVSNSGSVMVISANPNDTIVVVWEASDNIVSDLDSATIDIIVLDGQAEIELTYTATNNEGCSFTETIVVPVIVELTVEINGGATVCGDISTFIASSSVDSQFVNYEWALESDFDTILSTNDTLEIDLPNGVEIFLRGTSVAGCVTVTSTFINPPAIGISADFSAINTCISNDGSVTVISEEPNDTISVVWEASDNITSDLDSTTVDIVALDGQTEIELTYTATNSEGCSFTETIIIPVTEDFTVAIDGEGSVCSTLNVFVASSNIDTQFVSYEWSLESDFGSIVSTDDTLDIDLPEGTEIFLRGRSIAGCESEVVSSTITTGGAAIEVDAPGRICLGDTADIELILPAVDELSVVWDTAAEIISGLTDPIIVVVGMLTGSDTLTLSYTASNDAGCVIMDTIRIPYSTVIQPAPDPQIQCGTHNIAFSIDSIYQDGDVFWDFGMINGEAVTSTLANPIIDFDTSGVFNANLSSTMETCNFDPLEIFFEVPEILEVASGQDLSQLVCPGDSLITLGAESNGSIIVWTNQDGILLTTGDSVTVDVREVSSVMATVSDAFGCTASLAFSTGVYEFDISIEGPSDPICSSDPVTVTATDNTGANLSYMWISASGIESGADTATPMIIPGQAEDLVLVVTNEDLGCTMEFPFPVDGGMGITASISADPGTTITRGESVTLTVETDAVNPTFDWTDGNTSGTRVESPTETTTYTVTVTSENGCTAEASITITVDEPPCDASGIFIPDAFSPNNDNINDVLFVRSNGIENMDFLILNRWGKEVFSTEDQSEGWNGRYRQNGDELSPDVYAYRLRVTCFTGEEFIKAGNVSLIR